MANATLTHLDDRRFCKGSIRNHQGHKNGQDTHENSSLNRTVIEGDVEWALPGFGVLCNVDSLIVLIVKENHIPMFRNARSFD